MKLNPKCIRDIMLTIETMSDLNDDLVPQDIRLNMFCSNALIKNYSEKEIVYTLRKLVEANYVIADFRFADDCLYYCNVVELTYEGHQFLASISNSKVFEKLSKLIDVAIKSSKILYEMIDNINYCFSLTFNQHLSTSIHDVRFVRFFYNPAHYGDYILLFHAASVLGFFLFLYACSP